MKVPLGRTTLATLATGVLALGLASPPGTASADPDKRPTEYTAEPLAASDLVTAGKSQSSRLAETSPGLLRRDDARPVRVMIKLNYDGAASYPGGIGGLEATSPSVTGRQLTGRSAAETEYADYVSEEEADFRAALAETVPSAEVTGSYQVVYGGVRAVIPANSVERILRIDGVAAVQRNRLAQPLTDSSPEFIGAPAAYQAARWHQERRCRPHLRQPRHRHLARTPVVRRPGQPDRATWSRARVQLRRQPAHARNRPVRLPEQADRRGPLHRRLRRLCRGRRLRPRPVRGHGPRR